MKHTPGPWSVWTSNSWRRICSDDGYSICEPIVQNDGHPDLHFRNGGPDGPDARLIAKAPEMYEMLRGLSYEGSSAQQNNILELLEEIDNG